MADWFSLMQLPMNFCCFIHNLDTQNIQKHQNNPEKLFSDTTQCASSPRWLTDSGIVVHTSYLLSMLSFYCTHQHSRSQYASKVPDLHCDMVAVHRLSTREEEQDVTQHTHYRQRDQSDPQTLGKAARTHSDTDASASSTANNSLSFLVGFKTLLKLMFQVTLDWILSSFCPLQVGEVFNFEMPE